METARVCGWPLALYAEIPVRSNNEAEVLIQFVET